MGMDHRTMFHVSSHVKFFSIHCFDGVDHDDAPKQSVN